MDPSDTLQYARDVMLSHVSLVLLSLCYNDKGI